MILTLLVESVQTLQITVNDFGPIIANLWHHPVLDSWSLPVQLVSHNR